MRAKRKLIRANKKLIHEKPKEPTRCRRTRAT